MSLINVMKTVKARGRQVLIILLAAQAFLPCVSLAADLVLPERGHLSIQTDAAWIQSQVLAFFFSRIRVGINELPATVPTVTLGFRVSQAGHWARGAAYAVLPDAQGRARKVSLSQPLIEGTWGLGKLPAIIDLELQTESGESAGTVRIDIKSKPGIMVGNQTCLDLGFGPVDPQFRPRGSLFAICDSFNVPLTIFYAGAASLDWVPLNRADDAVPPSGVQIRELNPYLGLDVSFLEVDGKKPEPEHINFMFRRSLVSFEAVRRHELALNLGLSYDFYKQSRGATAQQLTKGFSGGVDYAYHLSPGNFDIHSLLYSNLSPFMRKPADKYSWHWWFMAYLSGRLPFKKGRWRTDLNFGFRYENIWRVGGESLKNALGPLVGMTLSYTRPLSRERYSLMTGFAPVAPPVGRYSLRNNVWFNEIRWQHYFESGHSWGIKARLEFLHTFKHPDRFDNDSVFLGGFFSL